MATAAEATVEAALGALDGRPLVVLTGAGMSTDSGIPDYRGPGSVPRNPMTYAEFRSGPDARRHYWARSHVGYEVMDRAQPNDGHRALAAMAERIVALITQNIDGLHEAAGSPTIALHGRIAEVICLDCGVVGSRAVLQDRMRAANPGWIEANRDLVARPDGDVELAETEGFVVPACERCGGVLKPDVVFFGENVPKERVERCYDAVESLAAIDGALVVLGSSLTVMSGLRFVRRAVERSILTVVVNRGPTRADELVDLRVEAGCTEFARSLADRSVPSSASRPSSPL